MKHDAENWSYLQTRASVAKYSRQMNGAPVKGAIAHSRCERCEVLLNPRLELNLMKHKRKKVIKRRVASHYSWQRNSNAKTCRQMLLQHKHALTVFDNTQHALSRFD